MTCFSCFHCKVPTPPITCCHLSQSLINVYKSHNQYTPDTPEFCLIQEARPAILKPRVNFPSAVYQSTSGENRSSGGGISDMTGGISTGNTQVSVSSSTGRSFAVMDGCATITIRSNRCCRVLYVFWFFVHVTKHRHTTL